MVRTSLPVHLRLGATLDEKAERLALSSRHSARRRMGGT
jgi:hypothetical protein